MNNGTINISNDNNDNSSMNHDNNDSSSINNGNNENRITNNNNKVYFSTTCCFGILILGTFAKNVFA